MKGVVLHIPLIVQRHTNTINLKVVQIAAIYSLYRPTTFIFWSRKALESPSDIACAVCFGFALAEYLSDDHLGLFVTFAIHPWPCIQCGFNCVGFSLNGADQCISKFYITPASRSTSTESLLFIYNDTFDINGLTFRAPDRPSQSRGTSPATISITSHA